MSILKGLLSEIPAVNTKDVELYHYDDIAIFKPCITINKQASFTCYHFIITGKSCNAPPFKVDNKTYIMGENKIFPINPGQEIYPTENKIISNYIAMFIERKLISNISQSIYGKLDIVFSNGEYRVNKEIFDMIGLFIYECKTKKSGYNIMLQTLSVQIALSLIRHTKNSLGVFKPIRDYSKMENIHKVEEFLLEHYDDDFTVDDLSKVAHLSTYHFIRVFKAETGKTPYEYLLDLKVEKAIEMLSSKKYSMTEVSTLCGFANPSHFSTIFKKKTGISPSDFNKLLL